MNGLLGHFFLSVLLFGTFLAKANAEEMKDMKEVRYDWRTFVTRALETDPQMREQRYAEKFKELRIDAIKNGVILPKFEVSMGYGVTPGQKLVVQEWGDTTESFDFSKYGPAYLVEVNIAQPLNLMQRNRGIHAAELDLKVKQWELRKKDVDKAYDLQEIYFGYLLAREMVRVTEDAAKRYDEAEEQLEEKLDDYDESVSQYDLLEMQAGRYEIDKNLLDARNGLFRAKLGAEFSLALPAGEEFVPADSFLVAQKNYFKSLDSAQEILLASHPDLRRLDYGLQARLELLELASAKLGPEILLVGSFSWAKSWVGERTGADPLDFDQDPVHRLNGALGIGIRYKLNVWNTWQGVRKERAEYRQLKMKDEYAAKGLFLQLEEAWGALEMNAAKMKSAAGALRATEAWLNGAWDQYELDPSRTDQLMTAYRKNIYAQRDYYFAVYDYNMALADVIRRTGLTPEQYQDLFASPQNAANVEAESIEKAKKQVKKSENLPM